jgi:hypothetical protein
MSVIARIEDPAVIERILTWFGLWGAAARRTLTARGPPGSPLTYHAVPDVA